MKDSGVSSLISESHAAKELYGLCAHPLNPDRYATGGDDGAVIAHFFILV